MNILPFSTKIARHILEPTIPNRNDATNMTLSKRSTLIREGNSDKEPEDIRMRIQQVCEESLFKRL